MPLAATLDLPSTTNFSYSSITTQRTELSDSCGVIEATAESQFDAFYTPSSSYVQAMVEASLAEFFVSMLPTADARLRTAFWAFERSVLRVWTVIDDFDPDFERRIHAAELQFLRKLPAVQSDFYIVYLQDRPIDEVRPTSAREVTLR